MNTEKKTALIIGVGYLGLNLAIELLKLKYDVIGTTRNNIKAQLLIKKGLTPLIWDDKAIKRITTFNPDIIISTVAPSENGDEIIKVIHPFIKKKYTGWLGYISATSVYGGNENVLDEYSKCIPDTKRGERRLIAEKIWKNLDSEIFRVSGIYGPQKSIFTKIKNNKIQIINKKNHLFNRIHIDDLVSIIIKCIEKPKKNRVLNVTDGKPCSQFEFYKEAYKISNFIMPKPVEFENAILSEMARSFWKSSKTVTSKIISKELNYKFKFPDYKSGLKDIWNIEKFDIN